jgi:hypothetical protein
VNAMVELRRVLDRVGTRARTARLWTGLAACWAALALVGGVLVLIAGASRPLAAALVSMAVVAGLGWWLVTRLTVRDPRWVARRIEAKNPDLSALLLAAVEQEPTPDGRLGFLQTSVVERALAHSRAHDWDEAIPARRLNATRIAHGVALACLIAVVVVSGFRAAILPGSGAAQTTFLGTGLGVEVEPGNTQIERGTALLVIAKFPGRVPVEASLVVEGAAPRPMTRSLDDPAFAGHVPSVEADLSYRVEFPGGRSEAFRVTVYEHPELLRVNATLTFPAYTNLPPKGIDDVRSITAVEGTDILLTFHLNKAVPHASLVDEAGATYPLSAYSGSTQITTIKATQSQRYKLKLTDADGRTNKLPADVSVLVTKNQPPTVAVPRPGRDMRVSPLEELALKADIKDDYGLVRYGVSVAAFGQEPKEIVLSDAAAKPAKRAQPDHLIDLEALKAQPDQVVSYFFWAEDVGPDGKPRRTAGDLHFAEVRHFEEIFRQGEQQSREQMEQQQQQQNGNAQQAEQLAELQKQIVNATWKLIRRETASTPTGPFVEDVRLIREAQKAVIEKATALMERLQAAASIEHLKQAMNFMADAETKLGEAADKNSPAPLPGALSAEQAAYQALLKLRAREFEVTRNNSRQRQSARGGGGSPSVSQQQLRQLDLTDEQNRYETQSAAKAQQERQAQKDREQRENLDLADRLKELARRQNDLTDRVKELQSALEQAKEAKQREELQQQLKRLREQQQQILRDTEDLQQRMEQPENRDRLTESREQVEQSRENVRQATEALEQGRLGQAVNEGTRAGRQMEQVRDQLRKDAANRFGEEMRDLRQQARQLDEDQQKLTKQLDEMKQAPRPGLRDSGEKRKVEDGLQNQKKQLDQLTERIQKTVQEAEKPEPLLAQKLYDAARGAAEQKVGDSIDTARRLAQGGITPDAADASRKAAQGTEQLRKGVEQAAETVLGGQTEALKRAQRELEELSEQVNREVASATGQPQPGRPDPKGDRPAGKDGDPKQPGRNGQPGKEPAKEPGRGGQPGKEPGKGGPGERTGPPKDRDGQPGSEGGQPGERGPQPRKALNDPKGGNQPGGERTDRGPQTGGANRGGPIREEGFREFYDRLRSAEDLIDDPNLRAEAARIRERVRVTREEFKRHAKEPDWKKLQEMVVNPLNELRDRVAEEVRRREAPDSLVPIDRDPVPPAYAESVRRYYERLGSGK